MEQVSFPVSQSTVQYLAKRLAGKNAFKMNYFMSVDRNQQYTIVSTHIPSLVENERQGSHRLGKIKFPDFSLTFPDNFKVFPGILRSFPQQ